MELSRHRFGFRHFCSLAVFNLIIYYIPNLMITSDATILISHRIFNLRFLLIIASIFLVFPIGCDGGSSGGMKPECIDTDALKEFDDCPAEGLAMVCSSLFCSFFEPGQMPPTPPVLQPVIFPGECIQVDCSTMECTIRSTDAGDEIGTGLFTISTFLMTEDLFAGSVVVDETDQYDYFCNSVVF